MSRNKKTGAAKHYAFLEFQYADVAATAAEAMDGYMLLTQKLAVRVVPVKVHTRGAAPCTPSLTTPVSACAVRSCMVGLRTLSSLLRRPWKDVLLGCV